MLVNRFRFQIVTFFTMIILSILLRNVIMAGGFTLIIVMTGYIIIGYTRNKKRINLLEENCDPQAFLDATEKQRDITGKNPKYNTYFNIDKAAGLMVMGEFEKAKEILSTVNKDYLSAKNGTLLIYTINLISCLYELGEISSAEKIFEKQMPVFATVNPRIALFVKLLVAGRLLYLNRYDESREEFQQLLKGKTSKRIRLSILYHLAQIDKKTGDLDSAKKRYKEVADNGNKLWIATQARKWLEGA